MKLSDMLKNGGEKKSNDNKALSFVEQRICDDSELIANKLLKEWKFGLLKDPEIIAKRYNLSKRTSEIIYDALLDLTNQG